METIFQVILNACFTLASSVDLLMLFSSLFETSQTLFWAVFGLVDLESFELNEIKIFTRFWGMLMFGTYSVINIVVLLNLLIAMMNHSYQLISVNILDKPIKVRKGMPESKKPSLQSKNYYLIKSNYYLFADSAVKCENNNFTQAHPSNFVNNFFQFIQ